MIKRQGQPSTLKSKSRSRSNWKIKRELTECNWMNEININIIINLTLIET